MIAVRPRRSPADGDALWLDTLRRYFIFTIPAHLVWEVVQLPLYTIWYEDTPGKIAFAAFHCASGDAMITVLSLVGALLLFGNRRWPEEHYIAVAAPAVIAGVAYTIFSEWHNTEVRGSWAYSSLMPTLPAIGTGLSPLLQWLVIPIVALWWARPRHAGQFNPVEEAS
jgi:hypothetical protein